MAFWGIEVKPGEPYVLLPEAGRGILRIRQATLGTGTSEEEESTVRCGVDSKTPVSLCTLIPNISVNQRLHLEYEEDQQLTFSVMGQWSIVLSGYYIRHKLDRVNPLNTISFGDNIGFSDSDDSDMEEECESGISDDQLTKRLKKRFLFAYYGEIEDEKPAILDGDHCFHGTDSDNGNIESQQQNVVKNSISTLLENEDKDAQRQSVVKNCGSIGMGNADKDGIPILSMGGNKYNNIASENTRSDYATLDEDRKRKISGISPDREFAKEFRQPLDPPNQSSSEIVESQKTKRKRSVEDITPEENGFHEGEASTLGALNGAFDSEEVDQDIPLNDRPDKLGTIKKGVEELASGSIGKLKKIKQKTNKDEPLQENNDASVETEVQGGTHEQKEQIMEEKFDFTDKEQETYMDSWNLDMDMDMMDFELPKHGANEQDVIPSEGNNSVPRQLCTRYHCNVIAKDLSLGEPGGKTASVGSKVSVLYMGFLKNGVIFEHNSRRKPYSFRLGKGEVIKGWDLGLKGMSVGDKRRLIMLPNMCWRKKKNVLTPGTALVYFVELLDVE